MDEEKNFFDKMVGKTQPLTSLTTQTTNIVLTDPLGSVVATFSTTAGSAALSGNQAYGPYGHLRYNAGGLSGMATSKGFSGLDYYQSRYDEPAVGVFLSADSKEGNQQGMDPYMYVGGNPQTYNDPTGEYYAPPPQGNGSPPPTCVQLNDCWSGSGGSGHPPTNGNGNSGTTKTQVKLSGDCNGLTAQQCTTAQSEKQNSLSRLHSEITVFQLLFGGLTLAVDFTQLILDLRKGLENIFSIIGDAIGILADITSLFSTAVTDFGWTSLQKAADEASLVSNSISSVWKTVRGFIDNGWGSFLATSIEFLGEGIEGLLTGGLLSF